MPSTELSRQATDARSRLRQAVEAAPDFVVGGRPCLDLANTCEPRGGPGHGRHVAHQEYLADYAGLVGWAVRAAVVGTATGVRLLEAAEARPAEARGVHRQAVALSDALYRAFGAIAEGRIPAVGDLDTIKAVYAEAMAAATLKAEDGGLTWSWSPDMHRGGPPDLALPLWPAAFSAIELLTEADPRRLKLCPGGQPEGDPVRCAWLFYDETKNRSRRWCTMEDCGSAAKIRRLTERRRSARTPT